MRRTLIVHLGDETKNLGDMTATEYLILATSMDRQPRIRDVCGFRLDIQRFEITGEGDELTVELWAKEF